MIFGFFIPDPDGGAQNVTPLILTFVCLWYIIVKIMKMRAKRVIFHG